MLMYVPIVYGFLPEINVFVFDDDCLQSRLGHPANSESMLDVISIIRSLSRVSLRYTMINNNGEPAYLQFYLSNINDGKL